MLDRLPGMKSGHKLRNLLVTFLYVGLLPFFIVLLPYIAAGAIGTNYRGTADKFARLPGVSAGGGLKAGLAAFVYGFAILGAVSAGVGDTDDTGASDGIESPSAGSVATATSTQVPTATPTDAPTTVHTTTSTPTATPEPPTRTPTSTPTQEQSALVVTVYEVVDGDTVKIRFQNGSTDTVRLLGVDTPEIHTSNEPEEFEGVPNNDAGAQCLRAEGGDSSEYTKSILLGKEVRLSFDSESDRRGSYGRLLAYVHYSGENFNYQLVVEGYARVYDSEFTQADSFYAAESNAQSGEIGVWRCRTVQTETPSDTSGSESSGLVVWQVHEDADGNDHENENDEYVVFKNTGDQALDLSGWKVEDEADHTYYFPSGFTLDAGATVTLYTGSGTDTASKLYWGSDAAIWNNDGDTVFVRDDSGTVVVEESY